ncbi:MAG: CRISPR-associated endoribonuclease Cas6 [bacterium]|jgi:CRISPR-associated endoribonuclease Cas6
MRIKIILENTENKDIILPIHYNEIIQKIIYKNLPYLLANFLHNIGFRYNNTPLKLFTFSKLFSDKIKLSKNKIFLKSPIILFISSPIEIIIKILKENLIKKEILKLSKNNLKIKEITEVNKPEFKNELRIKTLSPITTYLTLIKNNKKYTEYIFPDNPLFNKLIKDNIIKKYLIIEGITSKNEIEPFNFEITSIDAKIKILKYKNFIIKGVDGELIIKTDNPEIIEKIYDAGLGSKNSQGFGMFEIIY